MQEFDYENYPKILTKIEYSGKDETATITYFCEVAESDRADLKKVVDLIHLYDEPVEVRISYPIKKPL